MFLFEVSLCKMAGNVSLSKNLKLVAENCILHIQEFGKIGIRIFNFSNEVFRQFDVFRLCVWLDFKSTKADIITKVLMKIRRSG